MRRATSIVLGISAALLAAALASTLEPGRTQPPPHGHIVDVSFRSRALDGRLPLVVYLPPRLPRRAHALPGRLLPARPPRLAGRLPQRRTPRTCPRRPAVASPARRSAGRARWRQRPGIPRLGPRAQ